LSGQQPKQQPSRRKAGFFMEAGGNAKCKMQNVKCKSVRQGGAFESRRSLFQVQYCFLKSEANYTFVLVGDDYPLHVQA
jgi:hypothetical protein